MPSDGKWSVVYVEWLDSKGATESSEFVDGMELLKPSPSRSVGFLIDDHVGYKTLTMSVSANRILSRMSIPACAIQKIKRLK